MKTLIINGRDEFIRVAIDQVIYLAAEGKQVPVMWGQFPGNMIIIDWRK